MEKDKEKHSFQDSLVRGFGRPPAPQPPRWSPMEGDDQPNKAEKKTTELSSHDPWNHQLEEVAFQGAITAAPPQDAMTKAKNRRKEQKAVFQSGSVGMLQLASDVSPEEPSVEADATESARTRSLLPAPIVRNEMDMDDTNTRDVDSPACGARSGEDVENLPQAMPVDEEDATDTRDGRGDTHVAANQISVATKFSPSIDLRRKKVIACLVVSVLVVFGAIAGVVYAVTSNKRGNSGQDDAVPTSNTNSTAPPQPPPTTGPFSQAPTSAPTSIIFEQVGQDLFEEGTDTKTGPRGERFFGWSVDMSNSGDRLAVSLPYCPCVYIYDLQVNRTWSHTGIISDGPGFLDHISLSGDGTVIAIGMPGGSDDIDEAGGKVQVFHYVSGVWQRMGNPIYGVSPTDRIGAFVDDDEYFYVNYPGEESFSRQSYDSRTIALSEDGLIMAVGSPRGNYVRVLRFDEDREQWTQFGDKEFIVGEDGGDEFGTSVDLSSDGMRLVVGSPDNLGNAYAKFYIYNGQARVYQYVSEQNTWVKLGQDLKGERGHDTHGLQLGASVSISGDGATIALGANLQAESEDTDYLGEDDGHVKVFRYAQDRGSWIQQGNTINVFQFGLAIDEFDDSKRVELRNALNAQKFPIVTRLSTDGNAIAVSALAEAISDPWSGRGVVRLYELDGDVWRIVASPIEGSAPFDHSGRSIALSYDGSTRRLAIGSPEHNGNGGDQGQVRVFETLGILEANAPTITPTSDTLPSSQLTVPITVTFVSKYEELSGSTLVCGEEELEFVSQDTLNELEFVQVFRPEDGMICQLSFQSSEGRYSVYYGEDTSNKDLRITGGIWDDYSDFQENIAFYVSQNTTAVTVSLQTDFFPQETGFSLLCNDLPFLTAPIGTFHRRNELTEVTVMGIQEGASCVFIVEDSFGDGICCDVITGSGFYNIYYGSGSSRDDNLLVAGNGVFGSHEMVTFVISQSQDPITSSPTSPVSQAPLFTFPPSLSPWTSTPTATALPTSSPQQLVLLTVVLSLGSSPEEFGWSMECGGSNVASIPMGSYVIVGDLVVEKLMVEDLDTCHFIISASGGQGLPYDGFYRIFYGDPASVEAKLLVAGRKFDFVHVVTFKVSPLEDPITPSPTYVTESPTEAPTQTPLPTQKQTPRPSRTPTTDFPTVSESPTLEPTLSPTLPTPTMSPMPTREGVIAIAVEIQLNDSPQETGWSIECDGALKEAVPIGSYTAERQLVGSVLLVEQGAECMLTVVDAAFDGMQDGHFEVKYASGNKDQQQILWVDGSDVTFRERFAFTV